MKKKTYEQPEMKVVNLEQMDIICTSGFSTELLEEEVFEWSTTFSTESLQEEEFNELLNI